jgi:hypothetical protein
MTIQVGGHKPHPQNGVVKHKGPQPRVYANHGGTHHQMGKVHDAPTRGQVNDQNYAQQRVGQKRGR